MSLPRGTHDECMSLCYEHTSSSAGLSNDYCNLPQHESLQGVRGENNKIPPTKWGMACGHNRQQRRALSLSLRARVTSGFGGASLNNGAGHGIGLGPTLAGSVYTPEALHRHH
jgi:hypothetical protein